MKVLVAKKCGFCHGVRNAISIAEKNLKLKTKNSKLYSLGSIIHNKDVVEHLAKDGLKQLEISDLGFPIFNLQSATGNRKSAITVLIPSHGAAPAKIAKLKEKGLNIVDATCVLVKRVQHIAEELERDGYKVVVIGDENHPEVKAVVGCAKDVSVLANESDLYKLAPDSGIRGLATPKGKLGIVCQTTQSPDYFGEMLGAIQSRLGFPQTDWNLFVKQPGGSLILTSPRRLASPNEAAGEGRYSFSELKVINTLCQEAIKRQESAVELCRQVDIMFVLGGLESANTRKLAELCKKVNNQTFHLQNWNELDKSILFGKNTAGVTAGASTPDWIIAEFVRNLEAFDDGK